MKILILHSSNRTNGNTERLLKVLDKRLITKAEEQNITLIIDHVSLARHDIGICRGCRHCFDQATCIMNDDTDRIKDMILNCDALVLASPVYMEDVNGIMKNFIDRLAFCSHRPAFYGKCAVIISTSGSGSTNHTLNTMKNALTAWGAYITDLYKFRMGALMDSSQLEQTYSEQLSSIASELIHSVLHQKYKKPSLLSLISFRVQQRYYRSCKRVAIIDRSYWENRGWLDPHTHFYFPVKSNRIKLFISSLVGALLSKIFL